MGQRFCSRCGAEVEDVGGFCLLGHSLKLSPMTQQRAEGPRLHTSDTYEPLRPDPRPEPARPPASPERVTLAAPPPPPPPPLPDDLAEQTKGRIDDLWAGLEDSAASPSDPITAFAPNTRMYWGPEVTKLRKRRFKRS